VSFGSAFAIAGADSSGEIRSGEDRGFEMKMWSGRFRQPLDPEFDFHLLMHGRTITVTPMALQASDSALAERLDGKLKLG